jgi:hypothetical protein
MWTCVMRSIVTMVHGHRHLGGPPRFTLVLHLAICAYYSNSMITTEYYCTYSSWTFQDWCRGKCNNCAHSSQQSLGGVPYWLQQNCVSIGNQFVGYAIAIQLTPINRHLDLTSNWVLCQIMDASRDRHHMLCNWCPHGGTMWY